MSQEDFAIARDCLSEVTGWTPGSWELRALDLVGAIPIANLCFPDREAVWLFIEGPPASGKTLSLSALKDWKHCYWTDALTKKALVSAYRTPGGEDEPDAKKTLLERLHLKTLVMKEFTVTITTDRREAYDICGQLRSAFDGDHRRDTGVGQKGGTSRFGFIAACTDVLYPFLASNASLGERFLIYRIGSPKTFSCDFASSEGRRIMTTLMGKAALLAKMRKHLQRHLNSIFKRRLIGKARRTWADPLISDEYLDRLSVVASLLVHLRTCPGRVDSASTVLNRDAEKESRVVQQIIGLVSSLAVLYDREAVIRDDVEMCVRIIASTLQPLQRFLFQRLIGERRCCLSKGATIAALQEYVPVSALQLKQLLRQWKYTGVVRSHRIQEGEKGDRHEVENWVLTDEIIGAVKTTSIDTYL